MIVFFYILGVLYLGLARFYEYTHDSRIGQIIEDSYSAMLTRVRLIQKRNFHFAFYFSFIANWSKKIDDRYPLSLINGNNNFTGRDEIIITIGDLNLVSAMILVYKFKYNAYLSSADIDRTINGLLPFDGTNQALTVCLCTGEDLLFLRLDKLHRISRWTKCQISAVHRHTKLDLFMIQVIRMEVTCNHGTMM